MEENQTGSDRMELEACSISCGLFLIPGLITFLPRSMILAKHIYLATFFNFEINGLADRFLMEIEENVNSGREKASFQRYLLRTEKICNLK